MYLVTSEQMQALDRRTIEEQHVPGILLMEHAGKQVAEEVLRRRPQRVTVLCGKENNGGDGWVAARWLRHWGVPEVRVVSVVAPEQLRGDAAQAARMALAAGVAFQVYQPGMTLEAADVFVDGLLGTGTSRPLAGALAELVAHVNRISPWTIAIDVPTGVDASTGEVPGAAIMAQQTVCMAAQKLGTAVWPGCQYAGEVKVADIGIAVPPSPEYAQWVTAAWVRSVLPARGPASHKGTFGKVGIVTGEMHGAALLAGLGAARAGAGYVVLGIPGPTLPAPYEFIQRPLDPETGWAALSDCQAVVLGPGLGQAASRWQAAIRAWTRPMVVDADGLPLVMAEAGVPARTDGEPALPQGHDGPQQHDAPPKHATPHIHDAPQVAGADSPRWVLTPHPKECARLLGWTTAQVQARRVAAARALARATQAVVVLKGYRTVIAAPDGKIRVNPTGDASLATAGTGDVLAGIIGGLLAQGLSPFDAAAAGAYLHGKAGELAGQALSMASTTASDVVHFLPQAILALGTGRNPGE